MNGARENHKPPAQQGAPTRDETRGGIVAGDFMAGIARSVGPAHHPIFEKFAPEHVTQFLNQSHENSQAEREYKKGDRRYRFAYTLLGAALFGGVSWFLLPQHAGLYFDLLQGAALLFSGALGGYGFKAYRDQRRN